MPRKPRLHVPGALYHVTLRGNNRQAIYFTDADRHRWMKLLGEGTHRYRCRVHAYCWMTNHVHLAVQISDVPLDRLMHWLALSYSRQTNQRLKRTGHLFERRYAPKLVDADSYLLELVRYIHRNPVEASIVADPRQYRWSSHRAYLGGHCPRWLTVSWVLSCFSADLRAARRAYAAFMADDTETPEALIIGNESDERVIGDDHFLDQIDDTIGSPGTRRTLSELIGEYCEHYQVTEAQLASPGRMRHYCDIRARIAAAAQWEGVATLHEVAQRFGRSDSAISRSVIRLQQKTSVIHR